MVGLLAVQILIGPELPGTRDAADEKLRVEVRTAGEGEYLAVTRVHRYDSPSSTWVPGLLRPRDGGVELILGQFLHVEVHGQLQILARHGLTFMGLPFSSTNLPMESTLLPSGTMRPRASTL